MLIIFGGLPGVGKTTLAKAVAREWEAVYLRVDTIEQALRFSEALQGEVGPAGYLVAYRPRPRESSFNSRSALPALSMTTILSGSDDPAMGSNSSTEATTNESLKSSWICCHQPGPMPGSPRGRACPVR